ncbi:hypothetical protein CHS0354_036469 [Potamilus streckersoni]|uniref:Uncharacterized protein n=1 Tax=Potamilus streckersoni TaxID=2493646 RepID=A0AAE0SWK5_9BIVA|nr:hypothetical protein CHS0354_036469 [Potamilus streckersoni]
MTSSYELLVLKCKLENKLKFSCTSENYSNPKTYFLYKDKVTWSNAEVTCMSAGWHLGRIQTLATIPDLGFQDYSGSKEGYIWIGLRKSEDGIWIWSDGSNVSYTNWRYSYGLNEPGTDDCAVATVLYPFWWVEVPCNETHPFICEEEKGECRFDVYPHSSIISNNVKYEIRKSLNECLDICYKSTEFVCHSFEYNPSQRYCQFNSGNRWDLYNYFFTQDHEWVYYHRTCYTGIVVEEPISSISRFIVGEPKTSSVSPTPTMLYSSISNSIFLITSCNEVWVTETHIISSSAMEPVPSSSLPEQDPVEELHVMTEALKKRKKTLTKISIPDKRQSATFVGLIAIAFMCIALGSIILFDLLTFCQSMPSKTKRQSAKKSPFRWSGHLEVASKMQNGERVPTINDNKMNIEIITKTGNLNVPRAQFDGNGITSRMWRRKNWEASEKVNVGDDSLFSFSSASFSKDENSDSRSNSYSSVCDILNISSYHLQSRVLTAEVNNLQVQRKTSTCNSLHSEKGFEVIGTEDIVMNNSSDNSVFQDGNSLIPTDIYNEVQEPILKGDQTQLPIISVETALVSPFISEIEKTAEEKNSP